MRSERQALEVWTMRVTIFLCSAHSDRFSSRLRQLLAIVGMAIDVDQADDRKLNPLGCNPH